MYCYIYTLINELYILVDLLVKYILLLGKENIIILP